PARATWNVAPLARTVECSIIGVPLGWVAKTPKDLSFRALSGQPSSPRTRPRPPGALPLIWPLGEVAEWLNAPHSKCGIGASLSGVRIPPSPPLHCSPLYPTVRFCRQNNE